MLFVGNAHAFQMTHIQSQLQDYGNSDAIFANYVAYSQFNYLTQADSLESGNRTRENTGLVEFPTQTELDTFVEFLRNAHDGSTRTVGLNSLFQVSEDTLIQLQAQFNTGLNSEALRVTPSLKLGFTIAKQLDQDNSLTFSLSPKLILGGEASSKENIFFLSYNKDLGKVSNGTTVNIKWTHKF